MGRRFDNLRTQEETRPPHGRVFPSRDIQTSGGSVMTLLHMKNVRVTFLAISLLVVFGCHDKKPVAVTPPPAPANPTPPPPGPVMARRGQPGTTDAGGSPTLHCESRNAPMLSIPPELGNVSLPGNRAVSPASSVTYTATATGPGGSNSDTAR